MTALRIAVQFFLFPLAAFIDALLATETMGFYYAMFTLAAVYRLLIAPIIGDTIHGAASDMAGRKKPSKQNNKGYKNG